MDCLKARSAVQSSRDTSAVRIPTTQTSTTVYLILSLLCEIFAGCMLVKYWAASLQVQPHVIILILCYSGKFIVSHL